MCEKPLTKSYCVNVFFDLTFVWSFTRNISSIKVLCKNGNKKKNGNLTASRKLWTFSDKDFL